MFVAKLENVGFAYDKVVLENVNLTIKTGEYIGIIGANGSGKTTFLKLLCKEIKQSAGKIQFGNHKFAYVEQVVSSKDLSFPATVQEIVSLGLPKKFGIFLSKKNKMEIKNVLKKLDIYKYKKSQMADLSGGEQQKVKIAKALITGADVFIMDEPTCGIDYESEKKLIKLINDLNKVDKKTIIVVSHNIEHLGSADKIYLIKNKTLAEYTREEHCVCCEFQEAQNV